MTANQLSATLPCPMTAPWLRACSAVRQYVRVGCRSEPLQNSGLRWHLIQSLSLNKCATHITAHPAAPPEPPNPKTLCESAASCLGRPKEQSTLTRALFKLAMGALNLRNHRTIHRSSSTFLHVADLPKASTKPCNILPGRNVLSAAGQIRQNF